SWLTALVVVATGLVVGGPVGLAAGAAGGFVEALLVRTTDLFLALPPTRVAAAVAGSLGQGLRSTGLATSCVWWSVFRVLVRGQAPAARGGPLRRDHGEPRRRQRRAGEGEPVVPRARPARPGARARRRHRAQPPGAARARVDPGHPRHRGAGAEPRGQPRRRRRAQPAVRTEVAAVIRVRFLAGRLAALVALVGVLTIVLFALQEISGADPVAATLGPNASPEAVAAERARLGLDAPAFERYLHYVGGLLIGDMGTSFRTRRPVSNDIATYLPD